MHTLYESESFSVTHLQADLPDAFQTSDSMPSHTLLSAPTLVRHGFEIIDKRSGKEVYLDGAWAELFHQKITAWQITTPTQEEVEDTLEGYASLAHNPVLVH